jgi:hypothetical protein
MLFIGSITTSTFVHMSATIHRATTKALGIKAAFNAMNARSMDLEITSAQTCLASATREGSTESTTSYNIRDDLMGAPPVYETPALQ